MLMGGGQQMGTAAPVQFAPQEFSPQCVTPQGMMMNLPNLVPMNDMRQAHSSLTPLQRYTQDILNADGDCFDLDVCKLARLSTLDSESESTADPSLSSSCEFVRSDSR